MDKVKIIGGSLKNMPWQEKPVGYEGVVWRHEGNPITGRNPTKKTARIFNSGVIPYENGFVGVFRADHKHGKAFLHVGRSKDGLKWDIEDEEIRWKDENGEDYQPYFAYDPRLVKLEGNYYIIWCTCFGGAPTIGLGTTKDFKEFVRLENAFVPYNRNGVLFPKRIRGNYLMLNRPGGAGHIGYGDIFLSESPDLAHWGRHRKVMSRGGKGWWQGLKIGAGPIPIETSAGWLLFYHGVQDTCSGYFIAWAPPSWILTIRQRFCTGPGIIC